MTRSRWPVYFNALFLLWCAWWYCRDASMGLLVVAGAVAVLAWVRGALQYYTVGSLEQVVLTVIFLAANVGRIVPPDDALDESRMLDRVVTVVFASGLRRCFRPTAQSVTLVVLGGVPLAMTALGRPDVMPGAVGDAAPWMVGGTVVLMLTADMAQRLTQGSGREHAVPGVRELAQRVVVLCLVTGASLVLQEPLGLGIKQVQRCLYGMMFFSERLPRRRMSDINLNLPVPHDFGQRTRMVAAIRSDNMPGYLRENVCLQYDRGRWDVVKPNVPLEPSGCCRRSGTAAYPRYLLRSDVAATERRGVAGGDFSTAPVGGFCLPGSCLALSCVGAVPMAETNGSVTVNGPFPDAYEIEVDPRRMMDRAWPQPEGNAAVYLEVPRSLAGAVSNWVESCAGLATASSVGEAVRCVDADFSARFAYRLGIRMKANPDPLIDFMTRKEGSCTFLRARQR